MKLYSVNSEPTKDPALLEEYRNGREIGVIRVGEHTLFFRVRMRICYIPYSDIRRCFRRVFLIPANVCCGKGNLEMENLVVCGDAGELAQIQLPGTRAARELMKLLHERIPGADFSGPAKKKEDPQ